MMIKNFVNFQNFSILNSHIRFFEVRTNSISKITLVLLYRKFKEIKKWQNVSFSLSFLIPPLFHFPFCFSLQYCYNNILPLISAVLYISKRNFRIRVLCVPHNTDNFLQSKVRPAIIPKNCSFKTTSYYDFCLPSYISGYFKYQEIREFRSKKQYRLLSLHFMNFYTDVSLRSNLGFIAKLFEKLVLNPVISLLGE